jgi:hypothetical protein
MSRCHARRKHAGFRTAGMIAYAGGIVMTSLFIRCTSLDTIAGTGSQAGNGRITCVIYNDDGSPASGAAVYLRLHDFIADTSGAALGKAAVPSRGARTDAHGSFSIDSVDTGNYCIEVNDGKSHAVLLRCAVVKSNMLVRLPDDTLHPTGSIQGAFASAPDHPVALYVQVYGLERVGVRNAVTGGFVINDVPRGNYSIRVIASSAEYRPVEIDNIRMASNEANDIGRIDFVHLSQWSYSKRLSLNTSSSGAGVAGTVTNFPVLVRLNDVTFDFSQARSGGEDIRFTKSDGSPLSYEIERWDPGNKRAEFWVKTDTVFGNDSNQSIIMYWGNAAASSGSNGSSVFDTADGFIGVWHMNDYPSAGTASIRDYTANAHHATPFGSMTEANSADGAVGKALSFDGKDDYLNAGNVSIPGNYSVGLWVLMDTLGDYQRFIYKDSSYTLWYDKDSVSVRMEHFSNPTWWKGLLQDGGTRVPMTTGTWYYLIATFDGISIRLYKNGAEVSTSNAVTIVPRTNAIPLLFGQSRKNSFVNGIMDEIRIEGAVRSADWVRLCYMNQRIDDKLIQFK